MAPIQFGILMIEYQTIDVAMPLDVLSSCSIPLFTSLEKGGFPGGELKSKAIDIQFHHVNTTLDPVSLTSGFRVLPNTTISTCPPLDYLLVGGPDMTSFQLKEDFAEFVKKHVEDGKVLFTTCTGALAVASTGVLDGKRATVNHDVLEAAKMAVPAVKWERKQWVVDGNLWTAGGACAGMDMMANWVMENYGMDIARIGFQLLDFEPRDIERKRVVMEK
ncbi:putative intracellular protease 1 [Acephala macrosclerotiorum]|nr:putative intracellular protease 1 [Acephala macrosclerotiorum]